MLSKIFNSEESLLKSRKTAFLTQLIYKKALAKNKDQK